MKVTSTWVDNLPVDMVSMDDATIMWDIAIITDKKIKINRPNITIHDTKSRTCLIIDISVSVYRNMVQKEAEKMNKYRNLEIDIKNTGT